MNASVDSKTINAKEHKEVQRKSKQASDSSTLSLAYAADQKNRHENNKILIGDSMLHKKNDTRFVSNDDISNGSSINNGVTQAQIKEKNDQINSTGILSINNKTIKADVIPVPKAASEIATRKIETIQSVEIKNDSLLLTLYDNGEIDGDTVSVLMNGKVIMPMQGLTANGISKTIYLTPEMGDSIVLIMYAENLGSIPPNTGLLIVHDGEARHEIRFTGDLQKNSAIILRRKKKN